MTLGELREVMKEFEDLSDDVKLTASGCYGAEDFDIVGIHKEYRSRFTTGECGVTTLDFETDICTG